MGGIQSKTASLEKFFLHLHMKHILGGFITFWFLSSTQEYVCMFKRLILFLKVRLFFLLNISSVCKLINCSLCS